MLKTRVIPTMLWKGVGLVKGIGFNSWRRVGPVLPAVKVYNQRDVDELVLVDISATNESRRFETEALEIFASEVSVPFACGGGVRTVEDARDLLAKGADKVIINSEAYRNPTLVSSIAETFGVQCVTISVDYRVVDGIPCCFSHSGLSDERVNVVEWVRRMVDHGAGEVLLTSIERDGTMSGYDLQTLECVTSSVNVPVIASGGAGTYEDLLLAIVEAGASAAAAASIFHFTEMTPREAKRYLRERGVQVRNDLT